MVTDRKSVEAERQEAADEWMRLWLLLREQAELINAAERKRDELVGQLKGPAKTLEKAVGRNQPEKVYDVQGQGRKLVRVKYTYSTGGDGKLTGERTTIDTLELEQRE